MYCSSIPKSPNCKITTCNTIMLQWNVTYANMYLKETLQLILRKIHKMRFFPWLTVFLLDRWKYKLSGNNTILKWKITVLSQKLIIFCGLVNKYCCLLLSFSWHMRRKRKQYRHGSQREKRTVWTVSYTHLTLPTICSV